MFPNQDAVNRHVYWTDPVLRFAPGINGAPHRIIGVTADIDDEHLIPGPVVTIYSPFEDGTLFKGAIDSDDGPRNEVFVVDIGSDADDAMWRAVNPGGESQHGIGPIDVAIDGILIGEHAPGQSLTDDRDGLFPFLAVETVEIAAGDDGNTKRGKESGRNDAHLRARVLFASGMNMTVGGELEAETAIAPGNNHAESGLADAGQRINATNRFLIEIDHLPRCFSVGHNGNVDREDVACVETRLRRLQRDQRGDHCTCAGQQHEGCSDLYHREDSLAAAGAAGDPYAAARQVEA